MEMSKKVQTQKESQRRDFRIYYIWNRYSQRML